jgi:8-oxo-dGTP diphosphatase
VPDHPTDRLEPATLEAAARPVIAFGVHEPHAEYVLRLNGNGVVRDREGRIAVVMVGERGFLPGGGQEPGESPEAALLREAIEECGLELRIAGVIGVADELFHAKNEGKHFCKRGTFFTAQVVRTRPGGGSEPDHRLEWLTVEAALSRLHHESHRWAVRNSLRGQRIGHRQPRSTQ